VIRSGQTGSFFMRKGLLAAGLLMLSAGADATTTIIDF
jgi:hypothetical protein